MPRFVGCVGIYWAVGKLLQYAYRRSVYNILNLQVVFIVSSSKHDNIVFVEYCMHTYM